MFVKLDLDPDRHRRGHPHSPHMLLLPPLVLLMLRVQY
jgi:hypothetical protein